MEATRVQLAFPPRHTMTHFTENLICMLLANFLLYNNIKNTVHIIVVLLFHSFISPTVRQVLGCELVPVSYICTGVAVERSMLGGQHMLIQTSKYTVYTP